jgi:chromosomal replication initiation ATPase DnaA
MTDTIDTDRDWIAHYAAVKARIAVGRPRPPAPPTPAPEPVPVIQALPMARARPTQAKPRAPRASTRQARKDRVAARAARYSLTQEQIVDLCADITTRHGVTWQAVTGRSTSAALIRPRLEIYRRLLDLGWSYSAIGRACNRDHTTIIYYIEKWGKTDE